MGPVLDAVEMLVKNPARNTVPISVQLQEQKYIYTTSVVEPTKKINQKLFNSFECYIWVLREM
jgi:hypothetical protein